jgi:hypothetical protein
MELGPLTQQEVADVNDIVAKHEPED